MKTRFGATLLILSLAFTAGAQAKDGAKKKGGAKQPDCKTSDTVCKYLVATRQLLAGYQDAIKGQIDVLQKGYAAIGQAVEQGSRDQVEDGLRYERNRRSDQMAGDFIRQWRLVRDYKERLLDYPAQDFKSNRELLELDSLDGSRFVQGLQNLDAEFSKVKALDKVLEGLNLKKSLTDTLGDLGGIAQQTKTEFDTLVCGGLTKDIAAKTAAKTATTNTAESAALQSAIDALNKERTSKSCKN
jgi:hypothetical protein